MTGGVWHRRFIHDLVFEIEGTGWHAPEIRDNTGYRWTGPGRFSTLRVPSPAAAGRGELHLLAFAGMRPPPTELFLNGTRLATTRRDTANLTILDFAWSESTVAGQPSAEFWLDVSGLRQQPFQNGEFRSVGIAATCLILEPAAAASGTEREHGPALLAGRRFLDQHLGFRAGPLRLALRGGGAELRLEQVAIGGRSFAIVALALRPDPPELTLDLPDAPPWRCTPSDAGLAIAPEPGLAERLRVARLLGALPALFGRWLDDSTRGGGAPAPAMIAPCRLALAELARAAERDLALALTGEEDPFTALLTP